MRSPVAVAALLAACDTGVHEIPDGGVGATDAHISARCLEATKHSDFPWLRDNIFAKSCGLSASCHRGGNPEGGLDLTASKAYMELVGVKATSVDDWVRVVPGHPEESYLLVKLGAIKDAPLGDAGMVMPPNSPPLCGEAIEAIRRWIAAGAPPEAQDAGIGDLDGNSLDAAAP